MTSPKAQQSFSQTDIENDEKDVASPETLVKRQRTDPCSADMCANKKEDILACDKMHTEEETQEDNKKEQRQEEATKSYSSMFQDSRITETASVETVNILQQPNIIPPSLSCESRTCVETPSAENFSDKENIKETLVAILPLQEALKESADLLVQEQDATNVPCNTERQGVTQSSNFASVLETNPESELRSNKVDLSDVSRSGETLTNQPPEKPHVPVDKNAGKGIAVFCKYLQESGHESQDVSEDMQSDENNSIKDENENEDTTTFAGEVGDDSNFVAW